MNAAAESTPQAVLGEGESGVGNCGRAKGIGSAAGVCSCGGQTDTKP
jgi:hypothetical protein